MKIARRLAFASLALIVVLGLAALGGRAYLATPYGAAQVAARLSAVAGCPVEADGVDVGFNQCTVRGVRLLDPATGAAWASVDSARLHISLWDLLAERLSQGNLHLSGAALDLRFDRDGRLLTTLPAAASKSGELPRAIECEGTRVALRQEGRPDFTIEEIRATASTLDQPIQASGSASDPRWGDWQFQASADRATGDSRLTMSTPRTRLTPTLLEGLPFLPPAVWQEIRLEGDTSVKLSVHFEPRSADGFHYQLTAVPTDVTAHVASLDVDARQVRGRLEIEDNLIHLRSIVAKVADGTGNVSGDLDFRTTPARLDFLVRGDRLDVHRLPKSWNLPAGFGGFLDGHAHIDVMLDGGKPIIGGSGEGVIKDAMVAGFPAEPIELKLSSANGRLLFTQPAKGKADSRAALAALAVCVLAAEPPRPNGSLPSALINQAETLVTRTGQAILGTGMGTARAARQTVDWIKRRVEQPAAAKAEPTTYLEADLSLADVDIEQFVRNLQVKLPFPIKGRLSFQVKASIPINKSEDLREYRLRGAAQMAWGEVADLRLEKVEAKIDYRDGIFALTELSGMVPDVKEKNAGSFSGNARLLIAPAGDLTARLALKRIPLARVLSLVSPDAPSVQGSFSGDFEARALGGKLADVEAWQVKGTLTSPRIAALGWTATDLSTAVKVATGTLSVSDIRGRVQSVPLKGFAEMALTAPYRANGQLKLASDDKTDLGTLPLSVPEGFKPSGRFETTAAFKGTAVPLAVTASGDGVATDFKIGKTPFGTVRFDWDGDTERFRLTKLSAAYGKGELTGRAVLPFAPTVAGSLDVSFKALDVAALSRDLPQLPVRVEGTVSGGVKAEMPAVKEGQPRTVSAKLDLHSSRLRLQNIPTEKVRGDANYQKGALDYRLEGETLGGKFELNGKVPAKADPAKAEPEGRLRLEGLRIGRLWDALQFTGTVTPRGIVDIDITFRHDETTGLPVGRGRLVINRLRWGNSMLAERMGGDIVLDGRDARLRNIGGTFAGGLVNGQLSLSLRHPGHGWFNLNLEGVNARSFLEPWPDLAARVEGTLSPHARGEGTGEWRGTGNLSMARGNVAGIEVVDAQIPLNFSTLLNVGRFQIEARDMQAQLGRGRATGRASFIRGDGTHLDGLARFNGVDLGSLVRPSSTLGGVVAGRVSGRLEFSGRDVRSLNDLNATLEANFQQTPAGNVPVVQDLARFLAPGLSASTAFQSGDIRARLARGVVRVERLRLVGPSLQALITGTVNVDGRLDLSAVANTGRLAPESTGIRALAGRIPAIGPVPVGLIVQANELLLSRLIYLRIGGTIRSPSIHVELLRTITDEAARFFLSWAAGAAFGTDVFLSR